MKGVDKLNMKDIQFIWYQAGLSRISSKSTCQKSIIQTPGKYFIFNYSNKKWKLISEKIKVSSKSMSEDPSNDFKNINIKIWDFFHGAPSPAATRNSFLLLFINVSFDNLSLYKSLIYISNNFCRNPFPKA